MDGSSAVISFANINTLVLKFLDLVFTNFNKLFHGTGFMKNCKVSPDAYIQMALQLTYYRDAGKFCLTYEATMTRLFREGRTETVRPLSIESEAWVKAMEDPKRPLEEKIRLLTVACQNHQVI